MDSGLFCLQLVGGFHQVLVDKVSLKHKFSGSLDITSDGRHVFGTQAILLAAQFLGLRARCVRQDPRRLSKLSLPVVARDNKGEFFVVAKYDEGMVDNATVPIPRLLIQQEDQPPQVIFLSDFLGMWSGELILFTSKANFSGALARFDFTWFIPAIVKYRKLLLEVLLISLVLQVIGLVTPLFFQVVMDKVLVNQAWQTLNVITVGLVLATVFESILSVLRNLCFSHVSSKIDVELGAKIFRHLLDLPLSYFHARRVGDSVARVRELENIRTFLTSNAMTLLLDLLFSFIFLGVMLWYSLTLTLIVMASIPVYLFISLVFTPVIRSKLELKFNRSAENQSFLVETLSGVDTVKAMALEPRWIQQWESQLAGYVSAGLAAGNISTVASAAVTLTSRLVTAAIMWMGATLVIDHQLSVGALVAFTMFASQVSSPILRLAQLWNDFQQVGISMSRLGDILNARTEATTRKIRIPRLQGRIGFQHLSFRYRSDLPDVIRSVNLHISAGEVIGIVGRSGSGKSTLTKLVQRLYVSDRGRVLIDGQDISIVDAASLRQQIGVVLQENMLFNRTIRDNIAVANPSLSTEAVIEAARLAGAHEFICELPEGYDTHVGEHGTGLSGGQRQRIAIARALITDPRVLIFDEATSALDYESEKIIQDNMRQICRGRTVLIIAHRLSAVRQADRIIVMERGEIVESGSHDELLLHEGGIYTMLYKLQQGSVGAQP